MTSGPRREVRAEQPYVAIPAKVTPREWGKAAALVTEIQDWLRGAGVATAGPPFFRYWTIGGGDREHILEVGAPVGEAVPGDGRVVAGSVPAGDYVVLVHTGDPERIDGAHSHLQSWTRGQGLTWMNRGEGSSEVWGGRFEFYLNDPVHTRRDACSVEIAYLVHGTDHLSETGDAARTGARTGQSPAGR